MFPDYLLLINLFYLRVNGAFWWVSFVPTRNTGWELFLTSPWAGRELSSDSDIILALVWWGWLLPLPIVPKTNHSEKEWSKTTCVPFPSSAGLMGPTSIPCLWTLVRLQSTVQEHGLQSCEGATCRYPRWWSYTAGRWCFPGALRLSTASFTVASLCDLGVLRTSNHGRPGRGLAKWLSR